VVAVAVAIVASG